MSLLDRSYKSVQIYSLRRETQNASQAVLPAIRVLSVDPSKLADIAPTVKEELDKAYTLLAEKIVFPQLKLLNFARVAFDPNGHNPENKRPFERVIYVKKIDCI